MTRAHGTAARRLAVRALVKKLKIRTRVAKNAVTSTSAGATTRYL